MPDGNKKLYADVLLPLALKEALTYELPDNLLTASAGCRVIVPLGKQTIYTGIIRSVHSRIPDF